MYQRLVAYKEKYNTTFVPERYKEDSQLGFWILSQRRGCKHQDRINLLNDIGFHWDARTDSWMEMYKRLDVYKEKYKNTRVPGQYKADPQLGVWVFTQRQCCKEKYRVDLLNNINFEWNAQRDGWIEMYQRLVAYKKEHKTVYVPQTYKRDPKLATWAHVQRRCCKDRGRVDLLKDIGFELSLRRKYSWMDMYQRLVTYKKNTNTAYVPRSNKGDPRRGVWVFNQRQRCKDKHRIDLLNEIGFEWKSKPKGSYKGKDGRTL